ncbi:MAG: response regulator [Desulfobacterales bacterium]|nr:response regulator [Desulfobacterales bacterium]
MDLDTIIADYKLPGMNGVEFLDALRARDIRTPVVMLTAYGTIEKAVDAMRRGPSRTCRSPSTPMSS